MMERVWLHYKSHIPRIELSLVAEMHTIPVVGDRIYMPPRSILRMSMKNRIRDSQAEFGIWCVVTGRERWFVRSGVAEEHWRIDLTIEQAELKKMFTIK